MKNLIKLLVVMILFSSCYVSKPNQNLYPTLITGNLKYIPRPLVTDSVKSKTYASLSFLQVQGEDEKDSHGGAAEFSLSRAHSFKNFNVAYGATFNSGKIFYKTYDNTGKILSEQKAGFGNFLIQTSIQAIAKTEKLEFRFVSLDLAYSNEFGDYKDLRSRFKGNEYYSVIENSNIFSAGVNTELAGGQKEFKWAIRLGYGKNFGNFPLYKDGIKNTFDTSFVNFSLYGNIKDAFVVIDASN